MFDLNSTIRNLGSTLPDKTATSDEQDENREQIAETGCRLCAYVPKKKSKPDWERTFSACWDPNDSSLLYVFSQNGLLKIINVKNSTEKLYHIVFRRFAPSVDAATDISSAEKPIRNHWDKVSLIPGKPGEILFLMGVSNTVYMTALPGSESPLAELTDADSSNYVYGSPVLQIYSQNSRVTAMAMSPYGHVFASGDENGFLYFINCTPPTSVVVDKEPENWWQCPTATPSHKNPLARAHNGPIFSLQWLPIYHKSAESVNVRTHYLATGSEDRMVRLWKITLGKYRGVSIESLMVLDTQSTHVLCMKAIRQPTAPKTVQRALSQWSQRRSVSNISGPFGGGSVVSAVDPSQPDEEGAGGTSVIYLAAGTEHGSVYMWRFSEEDCAQRFQVTNAQIDDGTRLLAILHSSNRPIINIAMIMKREPPAYPTDDDSVPITQSKPTFGRRASTGSVVSTRSSASKWRALYGTVPPPPKLILCVSDTVGVVRSYVHHKQLEERDNMSNVSGMKGTHRRRLDAGFRTMSSLNSFGGDSDRGSSVFGRRRGADVVDDDQNSIEGLMLTGESQFDSPVVGCLFQETRYAKTKKELKLLDAEIRENNRQVNFSNIASSLTELAPPTDYLRNYAIVDEEQVTDDKKLDFASALVVVLAKDEIRFYPALSLITTLKKESPSSNMGIALQAIDEVASNAEEQSWATNRDMATAATVAASEPKLYSSLDHVDELKRTKRPEKSSRTKPAVDHDQEKIQQRASFSMSNGDLCPEIETTNLDAPPLPNSQPPQPSPQPTRTLAFMSPKSMTENRAAKKLDVDMNESHTEKDLVSQGYGLPISVKTPVGIKEMNAERPADPEYPSKKDVKVISKPPINPSSSSSAAVVPTKTTASPKRSVAADAKTKSSVKTSSIRSTRPSVVAATKIANQQKNRDLDSVPSSLLDTPSLNASQALLEKYRKAQSDDVSVDTIQTTATDKLAAAKVVNSRANMTVYDDLISLTDSAINRHMPKPSTLRKQVDPKWLSRRQNDGPSAEDLKVLLPPRPNVTIGFTLEPSNKEKKPTKSEKSTYSSDGCGLRAELDEETLSVNYTLNINPIELFGEPKSGLGSLPSSYSGATWERANSINYMLSQSILMNLNN